MSKWEKAGMKSKKIIGLTGSIATGKSTAARIIRDLGYQVIDADKVAHELMEKDELNYNAIVGSFGGQILDGTGNIDRLLLGNIVFSDIDKLNLLNTLTHHNIFRKIEDIIENSKENIIFIELPILFELKLRGELSLPIEESWLIYVNYEKQLDRLIRRNNLTIEQAKDRIDSQMDIEKKRELADVIIYNDGDISHLEDQIKKRLDKKDESCC